MKTTFNRKLTSLLSAILLLITTLGYAQMETKGKEFWGTATATLSANDSVQIFVSSEKAASISLKVFNSGITINRNIAAKSLIEIGLVRSDILCSGNQAVETKSFKLTSTEDVTVYMMVPHAYLTDATIVYPSFAIPSFSKYTLLTYGENNSISRQMAMVAHQDSTDVEITLRNSTANQPDSVVTIRLDKGDCYQIKQYNGYEISGGLVKVTSNNHKVSVFCGNTCTNAGGCGACDILLSQVPPQNTLGNSYLVTPFRNQTNGYIIEVAATLPNTILERDGIIVDTLDEGEIYHYDVSTGRAVCIKSTDPILVSQIMKGKICNGSSTGDPGLVYISSVDQLITKAHVATANTSVISQHFMSFIVPKAGIDSMYIDGQLVNRNKLTASNCGDYYWYTDSVNAGSHILYNYYGFLAYIYGTGGFESYIYTSGSGLRNLNMDIHSEDFPLCDSGRVFVFEASDSTSSYYKWFWDDGSAPDSGRTIAHSYPVAGAYKVKLAYASTSLGRIDTSYLTIEVANEGKLNLIEKEKLIACSDTTYEIKPLSIPTFSYEWNNGAETKNLTVSNPGTYSVIATDSLTGCFAYDTVDVVFFDGVAADFEFPTPLLCGGTDIEMIENVDYNASTDSILSYKWYVDFQFTKEGPSDTLYDADPNNYDIELRIISRNGCRDSITKRVVVSDTPRVETVFKVIEDCLNSNLFSFRDISTTSFGAIDTTFWVFSDGDTIGSKSITKHFDSTGQKWVELNVLTEQGCLNTQKIEFEVLPSPEEGMKLLDSSLCLKHNFFDFESSSKDGVPSFYLWEWGDGKIDGYTAPTAGRKVYSDTGTYNVQLIVAHNATGCSDTTYQVVKVKDEGPHAGFLLDSFNNCEIGNYFSFADTSNIPIAQKYTRSWDFGDASTSTDSVYKKSYNAASAYNVRLAVLTEEGCRDTATRKITMQISNYADFTITDSSNCMNGNFYIAKNNLPVPQARFRWDFGDGRFKNGLIDTVSVSYTQPGYYRLKLRTETYLYGCVDTFSFPIIIYPNLIADPRFEAQSICIDNNFIRLTDSTNYQGTMLNNQWIIDGIDDATDSLDRHIHLNQLGSHDITLIAGSKSTCPDTASLFLSIEDKPDVKLVIDDSLQCLTDNTFNFSAQNKTSTDSITSYLWDLDVGINSILPKTEANYSVPGVKNISLVFKSKIGCLDTIYSQVIVYPQLNPTIAIADSIQCLSGNAFNISYQPISELDSIASIKWSLDESQSSANKILSLTSYTNPGAKQIKVNTLSNHGCLDSAFSTVVIIDNPIAGFTTDTVCLNDASYFSSTSTPDSDIVDYIWTIDTQTFSGIAQFSRILPEARSYNVKLLIRTKDGCIDSISLPGASLVNPSPTANFGFETGFENRGSLPIQFTDSSSADVVLWDWTFFDGSKSSKQNPKDYFNVASGKLRIFLYVENQGGCTDTLTKFIDYKSELQAQMPSAFSPNGDGLNDVFGPVYMEGNTNFQFAIYNRWGEQLFYTENSVETWDGKYKGETCQNGIYIYYISYASERGFQSIKGTISIVD